MLSKGGLFFKRELAVYSADSFSFGSKGDCSLREYSLSREQIRFLLVQKGDCSLSENSPSRGQIRFLLVSKRGLFYLRENSLSRSADSFSFGSKMSLFFKFFLRETRCLESRFVFFWFKKGSVL